MNRHAKVPPPALRPLILALAAGFTASTWAAEHGEAALSAVTVKETKSVAEKNNLPQTTESITAARMMETINVVDTEDAVKYLPSIFIRKRNFGDTQPVMATRTWGVNSSARSLVYADGLLLTALLANNNTLGAPRWGLVAPEEIERIDIMYGPFSAAYPGNSMGAVMEITTRMPQKFEASLSQTEARQNYSQYGTKDTYATHQTSATLGDRAGDFSWWLSANHQDSQSQPLSYITSGSFPAGTRGGYAERNKLGATADVLGASGLLHTAQDNLKVKVAYDLTPTLQAAYTFGLWQNDAHSGVQTYLTKNGAPTFNGLSGFGSGNYTLFQEHSMHSLALKSQTKGTWDWEAVASSYGIDKDIQRNPDVAASGASFKQSGKISRLEGTGWTTQDVKGTWRPFGFGGAHEATFGLHHDLYELQNVAYTTSNWASGNTYTGRASEGDGKTETYALWVQDVWRFAPALRATVGGRWEQWRAFEGYNFNSTGATSVHQPGINASNFSPKASLAWDTPADWLVTGSLGKAYRYPTVSELYQLTSVGSLVYQPNPNLKPEEVLSGELAFERPLGEGRLRISLFEEQVQNALISQTTLVNNTDTTATTNVDKVRTRGIELAAQKNDVLVRGLELSGSVTYADSKILSDPNWQNRAGTEATGKRTPYVPDWRATVAATYRPSDRLATTLAARYSGKMYSTMDNTDVHPNTFGGFSSFFVVDVRVRYQIDKHWVASVGIDNLNNEKYFLYHPFPQRTFVANLKYSY